MELKRHNPVGPLLASGAVGGLTIELGLRFGFEEGMTSTKGESSWGDRRVWRGVRREEKFVDYSKVKDKVSV